jgi:hypothetical protein
MTASRPARLPDRAELFVDLSERTAWYAGYELVEALEKRESLRFAQLSDPFAVVADRLSHHGALRLRQSLRSVAQAGDRLDVEGEGDLPFSHTLTILPYQKRKPLKVKLPPMTEGSSLYLCCHVC